MSDFFTIKANNESGYETRCPLGVGYDWRYVRRVETEYLAGFDAGFCTDIPTALRCPHTFYRFPFPWEDYEMTSLDTVLAQIQKRHREASYTLPVPPKLIRHLRHRKVKLPHQWPGGGGAFYYWLPCPFSKEFPLAVQTSLFGISEDPAPAAACVLLGEIYDSHSSASSLVSCGYCQSRGGLTLEQITSLSDYERVRKDALSALHLEVIKRLKPANVSCSL